MGRERGENCKQKNKDQAARLIFFSNMIVIFDGAGITTEIFLLLLLLLYDAVVMVTVRANEVLHPARTESGC